MSIINEFHEFCCSTISSINYRIFFCEQLQNNYYKALEKATYTIYETTYKTICITIFAQVTHSRTRCTVQKILDSTMLPTSTTLLRINTYFDVIF
jgi:hypothetical protein